MALTGPIDDLIDAAVRGFLDGQYQRRLMDEY